MVPDQEPKPETPTAGGSTAPALRRGRRSGRGRRGRGRRHGPRPPMESRPERQEEAGPPLEQPAAENLQATGALHDEPPREAPRPSQREFQPASPANVQQAISDVNEIIQSLRDALDDMEEVLETLELAERQKTADEHEIDALRRALRNLQRTRESGSTTPRSGPSSESH